MVDLKLSDFLTKEIVGPFVIVIGCFIFYTIISRLLRKMFQLKIKTNSINYRKQETLSSLIINIFKYLMFLIAILMLLELYGIDTKSILASLGILGVVLGLALQDVAKDFIAGFSIIFEDQYNIGDTVEIGGFKGEIISLGLKTTTLKRYTGEIKILCNRNITEVINYSKQATVTYIDIPVAYNSDLKKVEEVLQQVCDKISEEETDIVEPTKVLGVNSYGDSAINFLIMLTTKPMQQFAVRRRLLKEVKESFDSNNIEIPYQQVVIHNEQ